MLENLSMDELKNYVSGKGLASFKAKQIYDGIKQGKALEEISNLSKNDKNAIQNDYPKYSILRKYTDSDGTAKYLIKLEDNNIIECVLMSYKYGKTFCISTQVGCRMGCKFCASTLGGLVRNLTAGEMLGQIYLVNKDCGSGSERNITNVVLMGSGEPLDNYDEVIKFLKTISSPQSLNISQRNISLSTCGIVPMIYKLADDGFSVTLTISLHAPNDEIRARTMPIANKYSISEILEACKYYFSKTGRRIIFEYTLIKGVNDSDEAAAELSDRLKGLTCHVNVIPLNEVKERSLISAGRAKAYQFAKKLSSLGLSATVRRTLGEEIGGSCGQLRASVLKKEGV